MEKFDVEMFDNDETPDEIEIVDDDCNDEVEIIDDDDGNRGGSEKFM